MEPSLNGQRPDEYFRTGFRINAWASASLYPILGRFLKLADSLDKRSKFRFAAFAAAPRDRKNFQAVFNTLTHLKVPQEMVLDCFRAGNRSGYHPRFYIRRSRALRHPDCSPQGTPEQLSHEEYELNELLIPDGSPESYWEATLLFHLDCMFNLTWHAHYRKISYIKSRQEAEDCLAAIGENRRNALADWDFAPYVLVGEKKVVVIYTIFSAWQGLLQYRLQIRKRPRLEIEPAKVIKQIEYDCGIRF